MPLNDIYADTNVACSEGINKAFVVSDADLKHFFETGKNWVEEDERGSLFVLCKAMLKKNKETLVSDKIDTILEYSNPKDVEISAISLKMVSKDKNRTFQVMFQSHEYPNLLQVTVGGPDLMETQTAFNRLMAELKETTQWYSFLACRRWLLKVATLAFWIFFILSVCYGTLSVVGTTYRNYQIRKQYEESLKRYPPISEKPRTTHIGEKKEVDAAKQSQPQAKDVKPTVKVWDFVWSAQFLAGMGIIIGGVLLERITVHLFPKAVFEIGKGKERHNRLKDIRKWIGGILTLIILSGIIIPIINHFIMRFF